MYFLLFWLLWSFGLLFLNICSPCLLQCISITHIMIFSILLNMLNPRQLLFRLFYSWYSFCFYFLLCLWSTCVFQDINSPNLTYPQNIDIPVINLFNYVSDVFHLKQVVSQIIICIPHSSVLVVSFIA